MASPHRRIWIVCLFALAIVVVVGAVAFGALKAYQAYKTRALIEAARAHFEAGEWPQAKGLFAQHLIKRPFDVPALEKYAEASMHIVENRSAAMRDAAAAYYQVALAQPADVEAKARLFEFFERRADWPDLEYYSSIFLQQDPENDLARFYNAYALERLGRYEEAIAGYRMLVEKNSNQTAAFGNLARLLARQNNYDEAEDLLDEALANHPNPAAIELERARFLTETRQHAAAEEALEAAREVLGETVEVCTAAARLAFARRDWEGVVENFEKVIEIEPNSPEAYLLLAYGYKQSGEPDQAFEMVRDMAPHNRAELPEIMTTLVEMLIEREELDAAEEALAEYRAAYPEHVVMHQYLEARLALARGNPADAIEGLVAVAEGNPNLSAARYYLALAYFRTARLDQAEIAIEPFLRDHPNDANARALLQSIGEARTTGDAQPARNEES